MTNPDLLSALRPGCNVKDWMLRTLVACATQRHRSGRDINQEGVVTRWGYGSLYVRLRRLVERGWLDARYECDEDGVIALYKTTAAGCHLLAAFGVHPYQ